MDVGHELDELIDLIDRLRRDVGDTGDADDAGGPRPDSGVAGPGAGAAENRSIAGARAALARDQAQRIRDGLAEVRERARTLAEVNRAGQARRATQRRAAAAGSEPAPGVTAAEVAPTDALRAATRNLGNVTDAQGLAERVVGGALTSVPGAERAALHTAARGGATSVRAASDPVAEELQVAETAAGEGPGIEVLERGGRVHVPDTALEARWPGVVARAREAGVGAVLALDVSCAAVRGALVLYAPRAEAFDATSRATAALFADYVAVALAAQARIDAMTSALSQRDVIGQAKGILMAREGLDAEGAFAHLAHASQQRNVKLVQVARELVGDALRG